MRQALLLFLLLLASAAEAQDAIVVGAGADRRHDGTGGNGSVHWIRSAAKATIFAGASLASWPGTTWTYGTVGGSRKIAAGTAVTGEVNAGKGHDRRGAFRYLLLRAGVSRDLVKQRLSGELEWLQSDVERQQEGILRVGATAIAARALTLRVSHYQSVSDGHTSLTSMRGDYTLGRGTAIAGFARGRAGTVLSDVTGSDAARIRDIFGGVSFGGWTIVATAGRERHRVDVSHRIALPSRGARS